MATTNAERIAKKTFLYPDGTEQASVGPNAIGQRFAFAHGASHDVMYADFHDDVRACAMRRGFSEDLGNSYANAKGDSVEAEQLFLTRLEILKGGEWYKGREGEARPSLLIEAIKAMVTERDGAEPAEAKIAEWRAKAKNATWRAEALRNAKVGAHYDRLQAEARAAKRARATEAAASDSDF
jgi:hypothetical protein